MFVEEVQLKGFRSVALLRISDYAAWTFKLILPLPSYL
jgi:hypothetical protein